MKVSIVTALLVSAVMTATMANAQVPTVPRFSNFQGKLADTNGLPLNGTYEITFNIYSNSPVPAPANLVWSETHPSVEVQRGLFSVLLGSFTNLDMSHFPFDAAGSTNRWLEIKVGSDILSPTKEFVSVPYAFRASDADMVDGFHASQFVTNALTNEIIALQGATGTLNIAVGNLNTATGALNTAVGNLQAATNALNTQVGDLQDATNVLNTATNALQVQATNLQGATGALNTAVGNLNTATGALNTAVGNLQAATNALNLATNALQTQITEAGEKFIRKWEDDFTVGQLTVSNNLVVKTNLLVETDAAVWGIFSVLTNELWVSGTNIITNWPHGSLVTNLNADRLDGLHATDIVAKATAGATNDLIPQIVALQRATNTLNLATNSLQTQVMELQDATNDLSTEIVALQDATNILNIASNSLQTQVSVLQEATNNLQTQVVELQDATNVLNVATNALQTQVTGLQDATNVLNVATNALQGQIAGINANFIRKWEDDFTVGQLTVSNNLVVKTNLLVETDAAVWGIFSVLTNELWVSGTNIITNWPHTSLVTNLNADMVDGKHADQLGKTYAGEAPIDITDTTIKLNYDSDYFTLENSSLVIVDGAVTSTKIADNAVLNAKIADNAVTTAKIQNGTIVDADIAPNANIAASKINESDPQVADNMANNSVPRWDGAKLIIGTIFDSGKIGIGKPGPRTRLDFSNAGSFPADIIGLYDGGANTRYGLGIDTTGGGSPAGGLVLYSGDRGFAFRTQNISGSEKLTITAGGNVGIGTVNPGTKLDVAGPDTIGIRYLKSGAKDARIAIGDPTKTWSWAVGWAGAGDFSLLEEGIAGDRIYVKQGGNVGIGTPSPAYKLHVNGNAQFNDYVNVLGSLTVLANVYAQTMRTIVAYDFYYPLFTLRATDGFSVLVPPKGGFRVTDYTGNIRNNLVLTENGYLHVAADVYARGVKLTSDGRTKFDQRPLNYGLAQIMALGPKRYESAESEYNLETEEIVIHPEKTTNDIGLVAQEVFQVIPEAVGVPEDENSEFWTLSYNTIIPVLVKAIQEQQAQIETLKQDKQALAASVTSTDTPLTADFDGDDRTDRSLVSASGDWYFWLSSSGFVKIGPYNFGITGKPVVADFDNDGKADPGIVSASGEWYAWLSASGYSQSKL